MGGWGLAVVTVGEFAFGVVRGEHLTMRGWEFAFRNDVRRTYCISTRPVRDEARVELIPLSSCVVNSTTAWSHPILARSPKKPTDFRIRNATATKGAVASGRAARRAAGGGDSYPPCWAARRLNESFSSWSARFTP